MQIVDGKIVINNASLQVAAASSQPLIRNRIVETHTGTRVTSSSFSNRISSKKWTEEENALFYSGISQFGLSPGMISQLFPDRNNKQLVAKLNREERLNPDKIEDALKNRITVNETLFLEKMNETQNKIKADKLKDTAEV